MEETITTSTTIINIVDSIEKINYGIWKAAASTAVELKKLGIKLELWFPEPQSGQIPKNELPEIKLRPLISLKLKYCKEILAAENYDKKNTIVISHGCWQFPSKWANFIRQQGIKWIYTPHGMLEPWSLKQKKAKKKIYAILFENRYAKNADIIRAVGIPEFENLKRKFENTIHIPNGIDVNISKNIAKSTELISFLFLARLHFKKGILPLVKAWTQSELASNKACELIIAGPDQGELIKIKAELEKTQVNNVILTGAVYGNAKTELLNKSHYYILPSHSEGFPTSILEAMSYGLIPIISIGCNFPEVFERKMAFEVEPSVASILKTLNKIIQIKKEEFEMLSVENQKFVANNYAISHIAMQHYKLFKNLLQSYNM